MNPLGTFNQSNGLAVTVELPSAGRVSLVAIGGAACP